MARVVMHVDLDAFYASVEQLKHPQLRGQPVIVGGLGLAGERGVVAAASYEARAFGVRSAMPLTRARRLCPQGNFVPADFAAYRQASRQVFRILTDYSPTIEPLSLDEAYLDLTGSEALLGPVAEVAAGLQARVQREGGLDLSIGVATGKVVAKVASDLRKPRGLVIVPAGQEAGFLAPLPLSRLPGCGPATNARGTPRGAQEHFARGHLRARPPGPGRDPEHGTIAAAGRGREPARAGPGRSDRDPQAALSTLRHALAPGDAARRQ